MSTNPDDRPTADQIESEATDSIQLDSSPKELRQPRLWEWIPRESKVALALVATAVLAVVLVIGLDHEESRVDSKQPPAPTQLEIPFAKPVTISKIDITGSPCVPAVSAPELVSSLTASQAANGKTIIAEGLRTRTDRSGIIAALAVSMRQTEMRNLANSAVPASVALPNDGITRVRHELGIFGRTPSEGPVRTRMTPARAARSFFADMRFPGDGTQWTPEDLADRMTPHREPQPIGVSVGHCPASAFVAFSVEFYERHVDEVTNEMATDQYPDDNAETMPPMASARTARYS